MMFGLLYINDTSQYKLFNWNTVFSICSNNEGLKRA